MVLRFYTDGACSGNGKEDACGGWGVVVCLPKKQVRLSGGEKATTNNRMELTAVIKALLWYTKHRKEIKTNRVQIYSDSSYVVNAVNQNWLLFWKRNGFINSKKEEVKNKDLWLKFIEVKTEIEKDYGVKIEFVKVKGHDGIALNVLADKLATTAVDRVKG